MIVQQVNEMPWSKYMYMYGALVRVYVHYVQNLFDIKILNFLQVFQTTFISHFGQNLWTNFAET